MTATAAAAEPNAQRRLRDRVVRVRRLCGAWGVRAVPTGDPPRAGILAVAPLPAAAFLAAGAAARTG